MNRSLRYCGRLFTDAEIDRIRRLTDDGCRRLPPRPSIGSATKVDRAAATPASNDTSSPSESARTSRRPSRFISLGRNRCITPLSASGDGE